MKQSLATRAIPSPKLLVKDHKTINKKGGLPTRLVITATKFTATFSKIGYLGIKRMLDKGKVNYSRFSIFQAYDLRERLEKLKIRIDEVAIASVDDINMYPSIKILSIKKAVRFSASKLTAETNKTINLCMYLVCFGMISILVSFDGEYYEYHGGEEEEKGLAIGGYESAFLANLFASYLFEKATGNFNPTTYHGIYIDDGLVVFTGNISAKEVKYWL